MSHINSLAKEFDVSVIANFDEFMPADLNWISFTSFDIRRKINPVKDLKALYALTTYFRAEKFDLVLSVTPKAGLLCMLASAFASIPIRIHWFTGQVWANKAGFRRFILKTLDKLVFKLSTAILVDSPSQKKFLINQDVITSNKSYVLAEGSISGVDTKRFLPSQASRKSLRSRFHVSEDTCVILFLGRVNQEKGILVLLEALKMIPRTNDVKLFVVGPDENDLFSPQNSHSLNLDDRVITFGYTDVPEQFMAMADIFCLPSFREGFGTSVLEAAACGVPTVASKIYGLTDAVIDGETGLLIEVNDKHALHAALNALIKNRDYRIEMGRAARKRALLHFSESLLTEEFFNFIVNQIAVSTDIGIGESP